MYKHQTQSRVSIFSSASEEFKARLQQIACTSGSPTTEDKSSNFFQSNSEDEPHKNGRRVAMNPGTVFRLPGMPKVRILDDAERRRIHRKEMDEKLKEMRESERKARLDKAREWNPLSQNQRSNDNQEGSTLLAAGDEQKPVVTLKKTVKKPMPVASGKIDNSNLIVSLSKLPYHRTKPPTANVRKLLAKLGKSHLITEVRVPAKQRRAEMLAMAAAESSIGRNFGLNQTPQMVRTINSELPMYEGGSHEPYSPSSLSRESTPESKTSPLVPIRPETDFEAFSPSPVVTSDSESDKSSCYNSDSDLDSCTDDIETCEQPCQGDEDAISDGSPASSKVSSSWGQSSSNSFGKDDFQKLMAWSFSAGLKSLPKDRVYGDHPPLITQIRRISSRPAWAVIYSSSGNWMDRLKANRDLLVKQMRKLQEKKKQNQKKNEYISKNF